jgi:aspartate carbamoyltransferase catalytic subunit
MKHLLDTDALSAAEATSLLDTAGEFSGLKDRKVQKLPTLRGATVANLFFEDSTRTRLSFESAAKKLSADVITFSGQGSSLSKGESLKDTAQTIEAMGTQIVVVRHSSSGAAWRLAHSGWLESSVVNAGDGTHAHPTQALLDSYTIRHRLHGDAATGKNLDGVRVVIVGDIAHSRVARSNVHLLRTLGAQVTLVAPKTLMPPGVDTWGVETHQSFDDALSESPDVVMMLRVQKERMTGSHFPSEREYISHYGLSAERFSRLNRNTLVMHPGPINRGVEISSVAADSDQSTILDQVTNGVWVRMAVLYSVYQQEAQA